MIASEYNINYWFTLSIDLLSNMVIVSSVRMHKGYFCFGRGRLDEHCHNHRGSLKLPNIYTSPHFVHIYVFLMLSI